MVLALHKSQLKFLKWNRAGKVLFCSFEFCFLKCLYWNPVVLGVFLVGFFKLKWEFFTQNNERRKSGVEKITYLEQARRQLKWRDWGMRWSVPGCDRAGQRKFLRWSWTEGKEDTRIREILLFFFFSFCFFAKMTSLVTKSWSKSLVLPGTSTGDGEISSDLFPRHRKNKSLVIFFFQTEFQHFLYLEE